MIAHTDLDKPIGTGGGNENAPAGGGRLLHGLERIHNDVQQHLLQMDGIGLNGAKIGRQIGFDGGRAPEQVGMEKPKHINDDFVQTYRAPLFLAFAHERVDSVNDGARSPRVRKNIVQQFLKHFQIERIARQKPLSGGGITGDRREWLIQLMRE